MSKPITEWSALEIATYAVNCDNSQEKIEEVERMIKAFCGIIDHGKSCPNCLSSDIIMFTSDLDMCQRCGQTF